MDLSPSACPAPADAQDSGEEVGPSKREEAAQGIQLVVLAEPGLPHRVRQDGDVPVEGVPVHGKRRSIFAAVSVRAQSAQRRVRVPLPSVGFLARAGGAWQMISACFVIRVKSQRGAFPECSSAGGQRGVSCHHHRTTGAAGTRGVRQESTGGAP